MRTLVIYHELTIQMMLHNQDSDMLLLDPTNKGSVFRMDLEYGKVVDEWKVSDAVDVNNIIPDTKYAQMNPQQTLIGHCKSCPRK